MPILGCTLQYTQQQLRSMLAIKFILGFTKSPVLSSLRLNHSTFSTLKQSIQSIRVHKQSPKAEIVSLLSDELEQLSKLSHYSTSIDYLQKNELARSYNHIEFALTQSKAKYPESINLHMFLLNRKSMLDKLLNQEAQFSDTLQQLFFMCLSLKGDKSLETLKHLQNFITSLIVSDPRKLKSVVQFLEEANFKMLIRKSEYLIGVCQYLNGEKEKGINTIQLSLSKGENKEYMKRNNLNWFRLLSLTDETLEVANELKNSDFHKILDDLLRAFLEAESEADLQAQSKEIEKNMAMTTTLEEYLLQKSKESLQKINPKTVLLNSQSHVIAMNIAHTFYLLKMYNAAIVFMKIGLEASIQLQQPYRIGLGLILMGKINRKIGFGWEQILLDILSNKELYSLGVLKECLMTYSRFLFLQKRYYEAEEYANQSQSIEANILIQGVVLPDFDFSY